MSKSDSGFSGEADTTNMARSADRPLNKLQRAQVYDAHLRSLLRADPGADLWLAARKRTEQESAAGIIEDRERLENKGFGVKMRSFFGAPTKLSYGYFDPSAVPSDRAIIVDLNKYRPGANLRKLKQETGLDDVILRMGGPTRFYFDDWNLTEDATYRKYYDEAKALGMRVGGYIVYSAGIDSADYANSEILLDFIERIVDGGRYMPDYIIVDDEVNTWWQNGKTVTATAYNQVRGIKFLMPKIWRTFRRVPMHYTARWFMSQNAQYHLEYETWLDNVNNTPDGKTVMNWYAFYLNEIQNSNKVYSSVQDLKNDIPMVTSTSIDKYLTIGSYSMYDLHQLSSNWITPFVLNESGNPIGVDVSLSRKSAQLFFADLLINMTPGDTTAPSIPQMLTAANVYDTSVVLSWLPSTDEMGNSPSYTVFVNGAASASSTTPSYVVNGLTAQTQYTFNVDAYDAAGNHSAKSNTVTVTTMPATTAPGCAKQLVDLFR